MFLITWIKKGETVDNKIVKNTKFCSLNAKVTYLDNIYHDVTTLIHINHYNTHKQNLEKKPKYIDKKYQIEVML